MMELETQFPFRSQWPGPGRIAVPEENVLPGRGAHLEQSCRASASGSSGTEGWSLPALTEMEQTSWIPSNKGEHEFPYRQEAQVSSLQCESGVDV